MKVRDPWLAAIIFVSLALKMVLALSVEPITPQNDENDYLNHARQIVDRQRYPEAFRPPLYPTFLALLFGTGCSTQEVRVAQVVLSTFSMILVFATVSSVLTLGSARVAAALVAFDPVQIGFSNLFWSETLYVFLLLSASYLLIQRFRTRRSANWVLGGIALGLAGLTRAQILTFLPVLLVWLWWEQRRQRECFARAMTSCALILAGCAVVILPWSIRNLHATGAFVLVDTNGPFNFLVRTERSACCVDKDDLRDRGWGMIDGLPYRDVAAEHPARVQHRAVRIALQNIIDDPLRFVRKAIWEAGHLWTLDSFALRHRRNGWYERPISQGVVTTITIVSTLYSIFILSFGLVGCVGLSRCRLQSFSALILLHATVMGGLVYTLSRYAVPLRPFLSMLAAWVVTRQGRGGDVQGGSIDWRRWALAGVVLVGLVSVWARDLPLLFDMVTSGGSGHQFHVIGN